MNCPVCNESLLISERKGIEIDYCPKCRGVWLDRGELDKIIDKALNENITSSPSMKFDEGNYDRKDYDSGYKKDDYYKQRRKKSLLGEIFDF